MERIIVAVKDRAVNAFGTMFHVRTAEEAIRSLLQEANNKQSNINAHPEDYDLYNLGTFNDETGQITTNGAPTVIVRAQDLVRHD